MISSENNERISISRFEPTSNVNQDNDNKTDLPISFSIPTSATPNSEQIDNKNSDKPVVNSDLLLFRFHRVAKPCYRKSLFLH